MMHHFHRDRSGNLAVDLTDDYIRAFEILECGNPLPVDLEMKVNDQGYNVDHLYEIHDMHRPLGLPHYID